MLSLASITSILQVKLLQHRCVQPHDRVRRQLQGLRKLLGVVVRVVAHELELRQNAKLFLDCGGRGSHLLLIAL